MDTNQLIACGLLVALSTFAGYIAGGLAMANAIMARKTSSISANADKKKVRVPND